MNVEDEYFSISEKRDTEIMMKDKELAEKNSQLAEKNAQLNEKDAQLNELDAQLNELDAQLDEKTDMLRRSVRTFLDMGMDIETIAKHLKRSVQEIEGLLRGA